MFKKSTEQTETFEKYRGARTFESGLQPKTNVSRHPHSMFHR